ncbi:phasin family protein [Rhizobium sp. KVB221]|uniref:Phasin family protein n=1 Tax=Rhizobium setariae TaxID=2801340 RepID=A0A936YQJ6_9HYPH|nr:phasin family protein [Rhizobium setariae]MBL0372962.1 phasin family protein [Rhizobium setariae]
MFKFDDANLVGKDAVDSMLKSYSTTSKGLQAIATETADYTKKSFEAGISHVEKLMSAKSVEAAFELQSNFAKAAIEGYITEMTKLGEMYSDLAKEAYKPVESTVSKATATVKANVEKAASAAA